MLMNVLFEIPPEILQGIENGEYIRKGGVVVTGEMPPRVVTWLKEVNAIGATTAAINPAVAIAVVAVASGFIVLNNKLNNISSLIKGMEQHIQEIKEIAEEIRDYQHMTLVADFRTAMINAERGVRESKTQLLEDARKSFCKIGEMCIGLADLIHNKNVIVPRFELYAQYVFIYYACAQGDIHCSMALNELETAESAAKMHEDRLSHLKEQFRIALSSATANNIEVLTYNQIDLLKEKTQEFGVFEDYIASNTPVIGYLKESGMSYLEYENSMKEFDCQSNAVAMIPKVAISQ